MDTEYGLQLWSIHNDTPKDLKGSLQKVADMGYKMVEFAGFFGHSAEEIVDMLKETGLKISGTHSQWTDLRPSKIAETIKFHKAIGNPYYIVPGADLDSLEKIEDFCNVMNFAQPILNAEGIRLGYHNHSHEFELMPWGSTIHTELEKRLTCDFQIDVYWAWNAGVNPVQILERLKNRIHVIHLKDGVKGGIGKAVGEGDVPVIDVIKTAKRLGFKMVVESEGMDPTGMEEVKRCIDYLKKVDGTLC